MLACVFAPFVHAAEAPPATPAAGEPAQPGRAFSHWEFEIRSDGDKLGTLVFDFAREGGDLIVQRRERLSGRKLLIRFSVDQRATERWRNGDLQAFDGHSVSETSLGDDEKRLSVRRSEAGALLADAAGKTHELPAAAWPATFWKVGFMTHEQIFEPGEGQLAKLSAKPLGKEIVKGDGGDLECTRYEATLSLGKHTQRIAIWYDAQGRLCALRQESGGDTVEYVRVRSE